MRRRTKRRPFSYRKLIITGTETSRWLFIDILDCSDLSWSTSFCIIPNLNHTFHLDASWKSSLRSIDSEPSLSSDEKDSILSWSKKRWLYIVPVITPDKGISTSCSFILWVKVDIRSRDKVIFSLYSGMLSSDSDISGSGDLVFQSNSDKVSISLNNSIETTSNHALLRVLIDEVIFPSQNHGSSGIIKDSISISNNSNCFIPMNFIACSVKECGMVSFFI